MIRLFLLPILALALLQARSTSAQKYNLTKAVEAPLVASNEPPGADCEVPGICSPVNQTIAARSLWYWCGFKATHRTTYSVVSNSATSNLTTMFLMRREQLDGCALDNVTWVGDRCLTIPDSSCSNKRKCELRVFGLVFPDETCFVIVNNRGSAIVATIQLNNFFDRPRFYGTIFTIIITVLGSLAVLTNVAWQFYNIILAPVGKHSESVKVKREEPPSASAGGDADGGSVAVAMGGSANGPAGGAGGGAARLFAKLRAHLSGGAKHQA